MKSQTFIPLLAGLVLLGACKGKDSYKSADTVGIATDSSKVVTVKSDTAQTGQKLVKNANIRFKVKNVLQTSDQINSLATNLNGMVVHHTINSTAAETADIKKSNDSVLRVTVINTTAEMTVKVPSSNMESFMLQVSKMGLYINNSHMDVTDKTLEYQSTNLKLKNQAEYVNQQKHAAENKKTPDEMLIFKNSMVDQQIRNHIIDDSVRFSTVTLSFYDSNVINRETIANDDLSDYNPPFFSRAGASIEYGWNVVETIFVYLLNVWFLIPIGAATWVLIKYLKKKKPAVLVNN